MFPPRHGSHRSSSRPSLRSLGVGFRQDHREHCESAGRSSVKFAGRLSVKFAARNEVKPSGSGSLKPVGRSSVKSVSQSSVQPAGCGYPKPAGRSSVKFAGCRSLKSAGCGSLKPAGRSEVKPSAAAPSSPPATLKSSPLAAPTSSPPATALVSSSSLQWIQFPSCGQECRSKELWIQFPCSGQECHSMSPEACFKSCIVHRNILTELCLVGRSCRVHGGSSGAGGFSSHGRGGHSQAACLSMELFLWITPISFPKDFFWGGSRAPAVVAGPSGEAKAMKTTRRGLLSSLPRHGSRVPGPLRSVPPWRCSPCPCPAPASRVPTPPTRWTGMARDAPSGRGELCHDYGLCWFCFPLS